ncbi:MAG: hypothetical protein ACR2NV_02650 [Thermoleophilaceae bacterium]
MRRLVRLGSSAVVVTAMVLLASLGLWIAVPVGWLFVGSQVQFRTGSVGAALATAMVGFVLTVGLVVRLLLWLSATYGDLREARGLPSLGPAPLEAVLVVSAAVAFVVFLAWFYLFSGASPFPIS